MRRARRASRRAASRRRCRWRRSPPTPTADRDGNRRRPCRPPADGRNIRPSRRHRSPWSPAPSTACTSAASCTSAGDERIASPRPTAHRVSPRSSVPMTKASTPPAALASQAWCSTKRRIATTPPARNRRRRRRRSRSRVGLRRADERRDLRRRRRRLVGRARLPRRRIDRDAPAPGIGRLRGPAIRDRQRVAVRRCPSARTASASPRSRALQIPDRRDHASGPTACRHRPAGRRARLTTMRAPRDRRPPRSTRPASSSCRRGRRRA